MNKKNTISTDDTLRIGTRTSPLAMRQTNMVADALRLHHPELNVEIVPIKSAADWKKQDGEKSLSEQAGGKGQFKLIVAYIAQKICPRFCLMSCK